MYSIGIFILHFTYLERGVRTHPTHPPPAYGTGHDNVADGGAHLSVDCCK